jgi:hypothetical protein
VIEQAKGMVSERFNVPMDTAFGSLRRHARDHSQRLDDLSSSIINRETDLDAIHVTFSAISAPRRRQLRERALERWQRASAEAAAQRERAMTTVSKSVEARVQIEHDRALRESQAMGRAIDRHFRDFSRRQPQAGRLPHVIVGVAHESVRAFVLGALRKEARLTIDEGEGIIDALGGSIIEQPDLVVLGAEMLSPLADTFMTNLRAYCPDSRTLVVVEDKDEISALEGKNIDRIVLSGDPKELLDRALDLCGNPKKRPR